MPPTRRKSNNPHSTRSSAPSSQSQSTLSFNNKATRVTKPSVTEPSSTVAKKAQRVETRVSEPAEAEAIEITTPATPEPADADVDHETSEIVIRESPRKSPQKSRSKKSSSRGVSGKDDAEAVAEKITDVQLKKYWKAEEDSRLAPRVHQQMLPLPEKILRHFDLSSQYGPCIGIPRLKRWKRAQSLNLNPPLEVLAVLLREEAKEQKGGEKARACGKLAYIDELSGGRVVLVD